MEFSRSTRKSTGTSRFKDLKKALTQLPKRQDALPRRVSSVFVRSNDVNRAGETTADFVQFPLCQNDGEISDNTSCGTLPLVPFFKDGSATLTSMPMSQIGLGPFEAGSELDLPVLQPGGKHCPNLHHGCPSMRSLRPELNYSSLLLARPSISTLRIATPAASSPKTPTLPMRSASQHSVRKTIGSRNLRANVLRSSHERSVVSPASSLASRASRGTQASNSSHASVHSICHFKSFCVLDTSIPGCPVSAVSEDLKYNLEIRDRFYLNIEPSNSPSVDLITGTSFDGEEITHLVMFTPLITIGNGSTRFLLSSMVDISNFIRDAAIDPECDSGYGSFSVEDHWSQHSYTLSSDDLLGGCVLPQDRNTEQLGRCITPERVSRKSVDGRSDDIWLSLAEEEVANSPQYSPRSRRSKGRNSNHSSCDANPRSSATTDKSASSSSTGLDCVLAEFMVDLQKLYGDFFVLARTALDDRYFEIHSVSPSLYEKGEYVDGHLTHTNPEVLADFSKSLAEGNRFRSVIRWGSRGEQKQCYCIPIFGELSQTWICMLVGLNEPFLW